METKKAAKSYSPELRERAVRMVLEQQGEHASPWAAIGSIAAKIGCTAETLRLWVRRAEHDRGDWPDGRDAGPVEGSGAREPRAAAGQRDPQEGLCFFRGGGARPPVSKVIAFMAAHVQDDGVEPMCRVLQIAPSTWHEHARRKADPDRRPQRAKKDSELSGEIRRVFEENLGVYGVRKVWRQLKREGIKVARCTVARLMKAMGLPGAVRGKRVKTTLSDKTAPCPLDRVNRQFAADRPNRLWVSDFTYVASWTGFVYVALVIDTFARHIVGWRVSRTATAGFVLDVLEQALHARRPVEGGLVHHSDRGVQYVSIKYTERLAEAGMEPSVGSIGDSGACPRAGKPDPGDNALAETIIGLFKTEVIHRPRPWRSIDAVEYATLEWVDWFNNRRLLEPIGNIPPAEAEANYYASLEAMPRAA